MNVDTRYRYTRRGREPKSGTEMWLCNFKLIYISLIFYLFNCIKTKENNGIVWDHDHQQTHCNISKFLISTKKLRTTHSLLLYIYNSVRYKFTRTNNICDKLLEYNLQNRISKVIVNVSMQSNKTFSDI